MRATATAGTSYGRDVPSCRTYDVPRRAEA